MAPESGLRHEQSNIYMMGIQDIGAASCLLYFTLMPQTTSPTGVVDRYGGDSQPNKGESAAHTVVAGNSEEGK